MEDAFVVICKFILIFFLLLFATGLAGLSLISEFRFDAKRLNVIRSFSLGIFLAFALMTLLRDVRPGVAESL